MDGTDFNTAGIVFHYAGQIAAPFSKTVLQTCFVRATGESATPPRVIVETSAWFNENLQSRNFYVPGVIVLIVTLMLPSMGDGPRKGNRDDEQIILTPIKQAELILGKTLPFALIGFADVALGPRDGGLWVRCALQRQRVAPRRGASLNPLRYFLIIRGFFLKGVGSEIPWPHMAALLILGVVTLWVATRRFRKTAM